MRKLVAVLFVAALVMAGAAQAQHPKTVKAGTYVVTQESLDGQYGLHHQ